MKHTWTIYMWELWSMPKVCCNQEANDRTSPTWGGEHRVRRVQIEWCWILGCAPWQAHHWEWKDAGGRLARHSLSSQESNERSWGATWCHHQMVSWCSCAPSYTKIQARTKVRLQAHFKLKCIDLWWLMYAYLNMSAWKREVISSSSSVNHFYSLHLIWCILSKPCASAIGKWHCPDWLTLISSYISHLLTCARHLFLGQLWAWIRPHDVRQI